MSEHELYLIKELAKQQMWKIGCEKLFGQEVSIDELPSAILEIGRQKMYADNTFSEGTMQMFDETRRLDTFEEYSREKVIGYHDELLSKQMLITVFEKELRSDYEKFCTERDR